MKSSRKFVASVGMAAALIAGAIGTPATADALQIATPPRQLLVGDYIKTDVVINVPRQQLPTNLVFLKTDIVKCNPAAASC